MRTKQSQSAQLFEASCKAMPGGVNSPVRAFKSVGGTPIFFERGEGPHVYDVDGNRYLDYVGSWGPLILGHGAPMVREAVHAAVDRGLSFGAPTAAELALAERIISYVPSIEKVRMVNSGTEAVMSAIRLARGYSQRSMVIKFAGCYHGHSDSLLVQAGSGVLTLGIPGSAGVPDKVVEDTLCLPYNDIAAFDEAIARYGSQLAAVIVEPMAGNMGFVLADPAFLKRLRQACDQCGAVLIFDEVMTGFRVGLGGAQAHYGVLPDITTLGKVIGGGMPVGAFGGKAAIMATLAPEGPVYQAGTLSGNPVAMAAGLATIDAVSQPTFFEQLDARCQRLVDGLVDAANANGVPMTGEALGGMFGVFFTEKSKVRTFDDVTACHQRHFNRFFHGMREAGFYFAPSMYEAGFVSIAHSQTDIDQTIAAAARLFETFD